MKYLILILLLSTQANARDVYVGGHYSRTNSGTYYVAPSHRTSPDSRITNNYGYTGLNPYNPQPAYPTHVHPAQIDTGITVPNYNAGSEFNE